jgi:tripartite-type tricarboxylate transporter receptor subunit TctC
MKASRREFLSGAAAIAAVPTIGSAARAQTWPTQPLRWVVGFPPGGSGDIVARIMAGWLSERLGQQVVIENKPGASTNISIQTVVNSPPDGNTLLFIAASAALNVSLFDNLPFDLKRDIVPVAAIIDFPLVLLVNPKLPAKTVPELIAYAKANPGKLSIGSFGTGTTSHVAGELFKQTAGIDMVHVPYRGGAPMTTDLIGGQVQVAVDVLTGALPHIQSGQIRALAMAGATRYAGLPDVPTIGETMPLFVANSWCGVGGGGGGAAGHAPRDRRKAQPRDRGRLARPGGAGQADNARHHADVLHAPGIRRLYRLRNREVAEGGTGRQHQGAVGSRRNSTAPRAV